MTSNQDYVFLQAQEMFPQLDADVVFMVLSENGFKFNDALQSLIILTQTVANSPVQDTELEVPVATHSDRPDFKQESAGVSGVSSVTYDALENQTNVSGSNNTSDDKTSILHSADRPKESCHFIASSEKNCLNSVVKTQSLSKSDRAVELQDCADNLVSTKLQSKSTDETLTKFSFLPSYVSVGKHNGIWLCFNGNHQRIPVVKSSVKTSKIFKELEKQLKNSQTKILKHSLTKTPESLIYSPDTRKQTLNIAASVIPRKFAFHPNPETKTLTTVVSTSHGTSLSPQNALQSSIAASSDQNSPSGENDKVNKGTLEIDSSLSAVSLTINGCSNNTFTFPHSTTSNHPPPLQRTCLSLQNPLHTVGPIQPNSSSSETSPILHTQAVDWRMNMPYYNSRYSDNQSWRQSPSAYHEPGEWRQPAPRLYFRSYGHADPTQPVRESHVGGTPRQGYQASFHNERTLWPYVMYILRGVSGSGKSTKARQLRGTSGVILSTDDYFQTNRGYMFDPTLLSDAHEWNRKQAERCLKQKRSPVIIDNTNLVSWEMKPYMTMAVDYGYKIIITEPDTKWRYKARELATKNSHGVSRETIENMLSRFEKNVTVERVLGPELFRQYQIKCLNQPPIQNAMQPIRNEHSGNISTGAQSKPASAPPGFHVKLDEDLKPVVKESHSDSFSKATSNVSGRSDHSTQKNKTPARKFVNNTPNRKPAAGKKASASSMTKGSTSETLNSPNVNVEKQPRTKGGLPRKITSTNSKKASTQKESNFLQSLDHSENNWSSFISDIESTRSSTGLTTSQEGQEVKQSTFSIATMTEDVDLSLVRNINNGLIEDQSIKVLSSNSANFKPASSKKPIKITKITFDKSTTTEDFEQNTNENDDLDTLRLLFSDYSSEDLHAIYVQCDKQLQWTTDVIAESSLFGLTDGDLSGFQKDSDPPLSLDDYYDTLCESEASFPDAAANESRLPEPEDSFQLKLPVEFLLNLVDRFGEVENIPEDCVVDIDLATAQSIYDSWKKTLNKKTKEPKNDKQDPGPKLPPNSNYHKNFYTPQLCELFAHSKTPEEIAQLKKDEALARKLQAEEHSSLSRSSSRQNAGQDQAQSKTSNVKLAIPERSKSPASSRWSVSSTKNAETLTKIINEEKAAEKAEQRQASQFTNMKLATQLKREELHEMYHSLPPHLLDEIFSENNFNLENTMFAINCIFDEGADLFYKSSSLISSPSRAALLSRKKAGESPKIFRKTLQRNVAGKFDSQRAPTSLEEANLSYDEIRREANVQRQQIHECQRKAAIANHQKKGALAFYYAKQANEHQKRLREANQRAATLTYNRMNEGRSPNELDLHGLHVDEAIDTLRSVINQRQDVRDGPRHLFVITGRGLNSASGIPRVKNAVMEWLKNKNIRFELLNEGYFKISF